MKPMSKPVLVNRVSVQRRDHRAVSVAGAVAEQGGTSDPGKEPQLPETLGGDVRRRGAGPADL